MKPEYAEGKLTCDVIDRICHLGLNDPAHMNAFTAGMCFGMREAVRAAVDDGVRRFVVYGHGRDFSAGANLTEYRESLQAVREDGFAEFYESERALIDLAR